MVAAFNDISPEDYLAAEADSPIKHEYRDGDVYAMAGGTDAHNQIAGNLYALLRTHLRGSGCRTYQNLRSTPAIAESLAGGVAERDRRGQSTEHLLQYRHAKYGVGI